MRSPAIIAALTDQVVETVLQGLPPGRGSDDSKAEHKQATRGISVAQQGEVRGKISRIRPIARIGVHEVRRARGVDLVRQVESEPLLATSSETITQ